MYIGVHIGTSGVLTVVKHVHTCPCLWNLLVHCDNVEVMLSMCFLLTLMHVPTVCDNITLAFHFYRTIVEQNNLFHCTDCRAEGKRHTRYCTMVLKMVDM